MNKIFKISNLRLLSTLVAITLAMPIPLKSLTGFYLWMSPFIMLNSVITLRSFIWSNIIALIILVLVLFRNRWFCYNLCPVGFSCDLVSGINKKRAYTYNKIPDIGRYLAIISLAGAIAGIPLFIFLDPLAIFNGFFTIFAGGSGLIAVISLSGFFLLLFIHLFLPGIWCKKICPLGAVQEAVTEVKSYIRRIKGSGEPGTVIHNPARRYLIMSGMGVLAGLTIPRLLKSETNSIIRPPASVGESLFNSLCNRCGNCIRVCPTGIIINCHDLNSFISLMTPEIIYKSGYCLEECNLCSRVCPTGAITFFDPEDKNRLFMGTAAISLENCLLVNNKECLQCKESCSYNAIEFISETNILHMIPEIDPSKCVGCGACMVICPKSCIIVTLRQK